MVMFKSIRFFLNVFIVFIVLLGSLGCRKEISKTEKRNDLISEIDSILSKWHQDAANASHSEYINRMAEDAVYIGTDATEYWTRIQFDKWSKPFFEKKKTWDFKLVKRNIFCSVNQEVVWFDELLETGLGLCRGSGVLEKSGSNWLIKQYVLSPTIPNDLIGKVVEEKRALDSIVAKSFR